MAGKTKNQPKTAFQRLKELIKWVDLVIEVRDARLPEASRHPKADEIFASKPRLIVLTKEDLADVNAVDSFVKRAKGAPGGEKSVIALSLKQAGNKHKLVTMALALTESRREALSLRGLNPRPMRVCVVGLPNVGKSSLINWLTGQKRAKTGNKPGITRGPQWVRVHPQLELLDTPGLLPPESFTRQIAWSLAACNLIPDKVYDEEVVADWLIEYLSAHYPQSLSQYGSDVTLAAIAQEKNYLVRGGTPDRARAASALLADFRQGRLGRISLNPNQS